jgi:hypothetical protein
MLDGLYPLQRLVDGGFIWQKGIGDIEAAPAACLLVS